MKAATGDTSTPSSTAAPMPGMASDSNSSNGSSEQSAAGECLKTFARGVGEWGFQLSVQKCVFTNGGCSLFLVISALPNHRSIFYQHRASNNCGSASLLLRSAHGAVGTSGCCMGQWLRVGNCTDGGYGAPTSLRLLLLSRDLS
jgi:hypothetical protein